MSNKNDINSNAKKLILLNKLKTALIYKFSNLFQEVNYSDENLTNDLQNLLNNTDLGKINYSTFMVKVEHQILNKVSNLNKKEQKDPENIKVKNNSTKKIYEESKTEEKVQVTTNNEE